MAEDIKTLVGIAISNSKTVCDVAIASVKSICNVDNTSGGGPCTVERENTDGSDDDFIDFTSYTRLAVQFTADATFTNCKIAVPLFKIGSPSGTINLSIWTDSSNNPGTQIGTPSDAITKTAITAAYGDYTDFVNVSASLTNAGTYWVVAEASALDPDGSNRMLWVQTNSGTILRRGWNGSSWDNIGTGSLHFILYST